jgi:hypothetical protein
LLILWVQIGSATASWLKRMFNFCQSGTFLSTNCLN